MESHFALHSHLIRGDAPSLFVTAIKLVEENRASLPKNKKLARIELQPT
jgi:hypothetical protein